MLRTIFLVWLLVIFGNIYSQKPVRADDLVDIKNGGLVTTRVYCTTQNEMGLILHLPEDLFPCRGEYIKKVKEKSKLERVNVQTMDSLMEQFGFPSYSTAHYSRFWDPQKEPFKPRLLDFTIVRLFDKETKWDFEDSNGELISDQMNQLLKANQNHQVLKYGKLTFFPHLRSHWYTLSLLDTKLPSKDLGHYHTLTHYFIYAKRNYSVTFNFDHVPNKTDYQMVWQLLNNFNEPCSYKDYTTEQLKELIEIIVTLEVIIFPELWKDLTKEEHNEVISCALERIIQEYSHEEFNSDKLDADFLDKVTIGCIQYMR